MQTRRCPVIKCGVLSEDFEHEVSLEGCSMAYVGSVLRLISCLSGPVSEPTGSHVHSAFSRREKPRQQVDHVTTLSPRYPLSLQQTRAVASGRATAASQNSRTRPSVNGARKLTSSLDYGASSSISHSGMPPKSISRRATFILNPSRPPLALNLHKMPPSISPALRLDLRSAPCSWPHEQVQNSIPIAHTIPCQRTTADLQHETPS